MTDFDPGPSSIRDRDIDPKSVNTDSLNIGQSVTMYVRATGDDANDGLSASAAKASVTSALDDAPVSKPGESLVLDLGDGTFDSFAVGETRSISHIRISGNGPANTEVDGGADPEAIKFRNVSVFLDNLKVSNGARPIRAEGSVVEFSTNVTLVGGSNSAVSAQNSRIYDHSSTVYDQSGVTGNVDVLNYLHTLAEVNGTVKGGEGDAALSIYGNSKLFLKPDADLQGRTGNHPILVNVVDGAFAKIDGSTISNADVAFRAKRDAGLKIQNAPTQSNIGQLTKSEKGGNVDDIANGESYSTFEQANVQEVAARVAKNTDQTIPDTTATRLAVDTFFYEDSAIATVDTANDKVTVGADGTYRVHAQVNWRSDPGWSSGDKIQIRLVLAGTAEQIAEPEVVAGSSNFTKTATVTEKLTAGDDVYVELRQFTGGSKDVTGVIQRTNYEVVKVG